MNNDKIRADTYIIDAFIHLTKTHQIKDISVKKIVEQSAINRRTFYDYFYSKEQLIERIDDRLLHAFHDLFTENSLESMHQTRNLVENGQAIDFNISICQHIKQHQHYYLRRLEQTDFINKFTATLRSALKPFSKDSRTNAYLAYGTIGYLKDWLQSDCRQPIDEIAIGLANAGFHTIYHSMQQPISS